MKAMPAAGTMTATEFLDLPTDIREQYGRAPSLVEGELVVTRPELEHQMVVGHLMFALTSWAKSEGTGLVIDELAVLVDERNVYAADVQWYSEARRPPRKSNAPYPMPDLTVEVRSPSTWRYDIGAKKAGYERAGLRELWLVDSDARTVLVFRRSLPGAATFDVTLELGAGDVIESPLLPGFALPAEELF